MATAVKRRTSYTTYGNLAYDPAYAPQREREGRTAPLVRPRERVAGKAHARVRPAGYVAPTAVIGFALVAAMAFLILFSYVEITQTSNEVVRLRREAATLADEHNKLMAQYELAFDLKTVEETVTAAGGMIQPQEGQVVTLDLSEPDSAQFYEEDGLETLGGLWEDFQGAVENVVAFFR